MAAESELNALLSQMQPRLIEGEYVFCLVPDSHYGALAELTPLASYQEAEGLSLLLRRDQADAAGLSHDSIFKGITLTVHSSLDAVGFTAAVSTRLASHGIAANVIAACCHDHVFVPAHQAEFALQLLAELSDL
ncbi:MAG: ACT domain-containing protein [Gammaproteobacteria bacterium]|jgi:hypothetical protein|nr:ACT domain-containing protein [Gammaproteobacteria bacterium]|tara:strand:+ start:597 stop:998 length:402 start_codon:yes stop_codon:yes gene_type:complete